MQSLRAAFHRRTPIFLKPYEFSTNVFGLRCRYYSQVRHNGALTDLEYHRVADDTLDVLNDTFEDLLEEVGKKDYDIQYAVCQQSCPNITISLAEFVLKRF